MFFYVRLIGDAYVCCAESSCDETYEACAAAEFDDGFASEGVLVCEEVACEDLSCGPSDAAAAWFWVYVEVEVEAVEDGDGDGDATCFGLGLGG